MCDLGKYFRRCTKRMIAETFCMHIKLDLSMLSQNYSQGRKTQSKNNDTSCTIMSHLK